MPLILSFLLLVGATQPSAPDLKIGSCEHPSANDARPYTLCLAEEAFQRADLELNRQWTATLARVRAKNGAAGERRLRSEQRKWLRARNRRCETLAPASPVTQSGRNQMSCLARLTEDRASRLRLTARRK